MRTQVLCFMGLLISVGLATSYVPLPIGMLLDTLAFTAFRFRDFLRWMIITLPFQATQWIYSLMNPLSSNASLDPLISRYRAWFVVLGLSVVTVSIFMQRRKRQEIEKYVPLKKVLYAK
ncbi:MAG: hypothetical protein ACRDF4_08455 [Rhabdochlamydiaceae bacterium]